MSIIKRERSLLSLFVLFSSCTTIIDVTRGDLDDGSTEIGVNGGVEESVMLDASLAGLAEDQGSSDQGDA